MTGLKIGAAAAFGWAFIAMIVPHVESLNGQEGMINSGCVGLLLVPIVLFIFGLSTSEIQFEDVIISIFVSFVLLLFILVFVSCVDLGAHISDGYNNRY